MIDIKCYPAKNGETFLVRVPSIQFAMLIDGGYADTFQRHIRTDLEKLAAGDYVLDIVVASHIDADHISGLLSFFQSNGPAHIPTIIPVREVLYNGLRSLNAPTEEHTEISPDDLAILWELRQVGYPLPDEARNTEQEISVRQGNSLAQLLHAGGYQWNTSTGTAPVGGDGLTHLSLPQVEIRVLGPTKDRLNALKKKWTADIRRLGFVGSLKGLDDVFEYLCAGEVTAHENQMIASSGGELEQAYFPDNSVTNGSSISIIVEIGAGRLLFLGDSWADDNYAALKPMGPTIFDAIKIAHHGSVRNTSPDLLTLVDSPHYFISTNGNGHEHPNFAVLKAIVDRPSTFCRTIHFNYSTPASRRLKTYQSKSGANFTVEEKNTDWISVSRQNKA